MNKHPVQVEYDFTGKCGCIVCTSKSDWETLVIEETQPMGQPYILFYAIFAYVWMVFILGVFMYDANLPSNFNTRFGVW